MLNKYDDALTRWQIIKFILIVAAAVALTIWVMLDPGPLQPVTGG